MSHHTGTAAMREVSTTTMTRPTPPPPLTPALTIVLDGSAPSALGELHGSLAVGDRAEITFRGSERTSRPVTAITPLDLLEGAGFGVETFVADTATVTRLRTLHDHVAPGLRVLLCGINPSLYAADAGVGFARPGNRFWPAALASGLVSVARDPLHALTVDRVGMTDLVKRATARADELDAADLRHGAARLERLVAWIAPRVVCVLGVSAWRLGVDRKAATGWQPNAFGGSPVYVMANPSGLNAHATPASLAADLVEAQRGAAPMGPCTDGTMH
jgi:TDG/mug DNA glycosylase family protein